MNHISKDSLRMHPDNPHKGKYDFKALLNVIPKLKSCIIKNKKGEDSIDFSDPEAVALLNTALLKAYHKIDFWDSDNKHLTPAVPGRCDHLLYLTDFLKSKKINTKENVLILDIGTGANCIYPILGYSLFNWRFVASESNVKSYDSAANILSQNLDQLNNIELRKQENNNHIFKSIIKKGESYTATICNPPFYASKEESIKESQRKHKHLKTKNASRNFKGMAHELWYTGGEFAFIMNMIDESYLFKNQVKWFSSLVAKDSNLRRLIRYINKQKGIRYEVIDFAHGNKKSRILAWQIK